MASVAAAVEDADEWLYGGGGPGGAGGGAAGGGGGGGGAPQGEGEGSAVRAVGRASASAPALDAAPTDSEEAPQDDRPDGPADQLARENFEEERGQGEEEAAAGGGEEQDATNDDSHFNDEHFEEGEHVGDDVNGDSQENGDSESDDSEDDVKVILGDIKSAPQTYPSLNIKRGGLIAQTGIEKHKHTGKFSVDDFEAVGTINGVPAQEFNIDVLEDKPWRKPGADLTDYFNYGFNEDTWRAYCERQKRMRIHESGAGLIPLGGNSITGIQQPRHPTPILNDNSKYSVGFANARKAGPPPGRNLTGPIDVVGSRRDGPGQHEESPEHQQAMQIPVRENSIQVMTADRREYSRNKPFPDMSLPPPGAMAPPPGDFFHNSDQQFYPPPYHQEDSWGNKTGWAPSDIKELTPGIMGPMGPPPLMGMPGMGPGMGPPPGMPPHPQIIGVPPTGPPPSYAPSHMHMHHREMDMRDRDLSLHRDDLDDGRDKDDHDSSEPRDRNRERDRDRDRSRSSKPDRLREKSHRRERSRSRTRRHKSRSRSPSSRHRSKKKSSHRKDKEDSD
ncbi:factor interacting with poly(A) polymerase 1 [Arctopsyche grandis]|uniref:factor interacting with poly(A) polymerase 1 n=1 Tax=Arctopsyche grandis TaxID=121162 RepID=UPI00406D8AD0